MKLNKKGAEEMDNEVNELNLDGLRTLLFEGIFYIETKICDKGNIFDVTIYIDDQHTEFTKKRPLAYIVIDLRDDLGCRVEVIDILESVRNDATAIGHPAITTAIGHWQNILIWKKYNDRHEADSRFADMQHWGIEKFLKSARSNLEAVGKALLDGAKRNAVPKEFALMLKFEEINHDNTFLRVAWERLDRKYIKEDEDLLERINRIESYLQQLSDNLDMNQLSEKPIEHPRYKRVNPIIDIHLVVDFLKDSGSKYVYLEKTLVRRPQWRVFNSAFQEWYLKKEVNTIRIYRKAGKEQNIDSKPYIPNTMFLPEADLFRAIGETLTASLVKVCDTIVCPSMKFNSNEFEKLLSKAIPKAIPNENRLIPQNYP